MNVTCNIYKELITSHKYTYEKEVITQSYGTKFHTIMGLFTYHIFSEELLIPEESVEKEIFHETSSRDLGSHFPSTGHSFRALRHGLQIKKALYALSDEFRVAYAAIYLQNSEQNVYSQEHNS
jgi:hypothetical protein